MAVFQEGQLGDDETICGALKSITKHVLIIKSLRTNCRMEGWLRYYDKVKTMPAFEDSQSKAYCN